MKENEKDFTENKKQIQKNETIEKFEREMERIHTYPHYDVVIRADTVYQRPSRCQASRLRQPTSKSEKWRLVWNRR